MANVKKAKGHRQVANHALNQFSHISIVDDDNAKLDVGQIAIATGSDSSQYVGKLVRVANNKKKGVIRFKCTKERTQALDDMPADGQLTITITNGPEVDPVDVTYVEDVP